MSKRFMCLVLSFVMILSMVSVTGFAADFKNGDFEASHVTFTAGGTAEITVKNNAAGSKNAVFWLGEYEDGVLTESDFVKYTLSAGEPAATTAAEKEETEAEKEEAKTEAEENETEKAETEVITDGSADEKVTTSEETAEASAEPSEASWPYPALLSGAADLP
jgi:hypothetical protein